jgi:peptidoglycan/LPS O-acetylase OafA/YrhL
MDLTAHGPNKYRHDIDGLRAIAVLAVIAFHLNASVFDFRVLPGGYVGVDIFFVISGYLITGLIHRQIADGSYSILDFYVRRARRIFPALFFMMAVTAVFVTIYCLPRAVETFEDSLIAATLFVSNMYFYFTSDYFAPAAETQPLLHTWSLAVEEQFYIFFPLLLLLIRRYQPATQHGLLIALAVLSLAVSTWLLWADASAAFYHLASRAWELLLGALLALGVLPAIRRRVVAEAAVALGLGLICISLFFYSDATPFPGPAALLPCLGAGLVIHGGAQVRPLLSYLLSIPPMRFVGLISYSLYLWHWPVFVMMQFMGFWYMWESETQPYKLGALAITFLLAIFSYFLIEQPFRRRGLFWFSHWRTLTYAAGAMTILVVGGTLLASASSRLWDLPQNVERVLAAVPELNRETTTDKSCFLNSRNDELRLFNRDTCLALSPDLPNYIVIGDSQANDLMVGLKATFPTINFLQATASGCKPVLGQEGKPRCRQLIDMILVEFLPERKVDRILLSARWTPEDLPYLQRTVQELAALGIPLTVFGPRVEYKHDLPWVLAVSMLQHDPALVALNRKPEQRQTDELFAQGMADLNVRYVSLYRALCTQSDCKTTDNTGIPLAFDYGHFTRTGSLYVAEQVKRDGRF